jgi:ketosteroid isomerase-like protein
MSSLEDELALRALMARYVDAVNRRDGDTWINTWAEDASWFLMGQEAKGRENILAMWQQMMANFEFAVMMPSSCLFEVEAYFASGHWYLQEFTRDKDGNAANVLSRYRDSYSQIDGQWLFQSRAYDVMYFGATDMSGNFNPLPA